MGTITKEQLELKKLTLIAWANMLYASKKISHEKYNKMVEKINKLKS